MASSAAADDFDLQWIGTRTGGSERRQVVVLAVSFTTPPTGDPERIAEFAAQRRAEIASLSGRFGGRVERSDPDLQLLCWGWPRSHEADPRFAVAAAIEIAGELGDTVRCGVDVGIAVTTDVRLGSPPPSQIAPGVASQALVGDVLKGAAAQAALATCGEVVISRTVAKLIEGFFGIEQVELPAGGHKLLAHRSSSECQIDIASQTAVIGRTAEMARLEDIWRDAVAGLGLCAVVTGEAGIGKSTLVGWMAKRVAELGGQAVVLSGEPERQSDPATFIRNLHAALLARAGRQPVAPHQQNAGTIGSDVADALLQAARTKPVLLAIENLNWLDRLSIDVLVELRRLVRFAPGILLLLTQRPPASHADFQPDLVVPLDGLADGAIDLLIRSVEAATTVDDHTVALIRELAEGNPFYATELARLSSDRSAVEAHRRLLAVPNRLNAGLASKLDELATLKPVAQSAAILGRTIDPRTLAAVLEIDERTLSERLQMLVENGILVRMVGQPPAEFRFKHALIWLQAYGSMLKSRRRELHLKIAYELIRRADFELTIRPQHVAHHFKKAGRPRDALVWWRRAAYEAAARGADAEAIDFVTEALAAKRQEPTACSPVEEAELMGLLARQEQTLRGRGTPEAVKAYEAAFALLSSTSGATNDVDLDISWGIASVHLVRGDVKVALAASGQLIGNARERGRRDIEVMALRINGVACFRSGRVLDSIEVLTSALDIARTAEPPHQPRPSVSDPVAATLAHLATAQALADRADDARATRARALDRAAYVEDAYTSSSTLGILTFSALHLQERGIAASLARASEHIALRHGYRYWAARAALLQALASAHHAPESELDKTCAALDRYRATESGRACVITHCLVAEIAVAARQPRLALELLSPYRNKGYLQGDWIYVPELKRLEALALSDIAREHRKDALRLLTEAEAMAREHGSQALVRRITRSREGILASGSRSSSRKPKRPSETA